ncbi:MAG: 2,3,4,5-tetrahydropyridine-2,6-dicarboxylate N-succinyltransferase [Acidobacteriota bacterium]
MTLQMTRETTLEAQPYAADELGGGPSPLETFYDRGDDEVLADPLLAERHEELLCGLERGELRAARPTPGEGYGWQAERWIKRAILLGFRAFPTLPVEGWGAPAFDRGAYPPRRLALSDGVRLVPGGSAVRRGAYLAPGVVVMPPAYVNVGAWVGAGTMIDSHALVGSCAQVGSAVHLSAGAQIGGVLEPPGTLPVVVEDGAFVGGQCGVFEGLVVGREAVLAPGVLLTASTEIFDTVHDRVWRGQVPPRAVVVPGSRPARGDFASDHGLGLYAPIIVKYRDPATDAATALEGALR